MVPRLLLTRDHLVLLIKVLLIKPC